VPILTKERNQTRGLAPLWVMGAVLTVLLGVALFPLTECEFTIGQVKVYCPTREPAYLGSGVERGQVGFAGRYYTLRVGSWLWHLVVGR
jgi:hypothetical protein